MNCGFHEKTLCRKSRAGMVCLIEYINWVYLVTDQILSNNHYLTSQITRTKSICKMRSNYLYLAIIASTLDIAASLPQGGDATPKKILVAIGDSFTSAVGAGQRESNDGHCRRFTNSYFNLLLREPVLNYDTDNKKSMNLACAGATTKVVQAQIGKDKRKPEIVAADHIVMSVGGNDVGILPGYDDRANDDRLDSLKS